MDRVDGHSDGREGHIHAESEGGEPPLVLVTEPMDAAGLNLLREGGSARVTADDTLWRRPGELRAVASSARGLIVRNQTRVDAALLDHAPSLRVVGRLGAGLDNIDLQAAADRGVDVVYAPTENAAAVAEYVLAALFLLTRRLDRAATDVAGGGWDRQRFTGRQVADLRLGIVGLGHIGRRVAQSALAFGMAVRAYDPYVETSPLEGLDLADLPEMQSWCDCLTLHVPLTPDTEGLVDTAFLERMKTGAFLINASRGGIVREDALADMLRSGRLGGAVLDVRRQEPPHPQDDPLHCVPHVWTTPHIAGLTQESQRTIARHVAEDVLRVLHGRAPKRSAHLPKKRDLARR